MWFLLLHDARIACCSQAWLSDWLLVTTVRWQGGREDEALPSSMQVFSNVRYVRDAQTDAHTVLGRKERVSVV